MVELVWHPFLKGTITLRTQNTGSTELDAKSVGFGASYLHSGLGIRREEMPGNQAVQCIHIASTRQHGFRHGLRHKHPRQAVSNTKTAAIWFYQH